MKINLGVYIQLLEAVDNNEISIREAKNILYVTHNMINIADDNYFDFAIANLEPLSKADKARGLVKKPLRKGEVEHWLAAAISTVSGLNPIDYIRRYGDTHSHYFQVSADVKP